MLIHFFCYNPGAFERVVPVAALVAFAFGVAVDFAFSGFGVPVVTVNRHNLSFQFFVNYFEFFSVAAYDLVSSKLFSEHF